MEEIAFRWIERFGFPVAMVVVCIIAISRLFSKNEEAFKLLAGLQKTSVDAANENTEATKNLTMELQKSIGSGPVCKSEGCKATECKATDAGNKIVDELRRMQLGQGLSDKQIRQVIEHVQERRQKRTQLEVHKPEGGS